MVQDETEDRGDGEDRLHDNAGPQVNRAHEEAYGRGREERAGELQPLAAREAALHPLYVRVWEDGLRQAHVPPPRQHDDGTGGEV